MNEDVLKTLKKSLIEKGYQKLEELSRDICEGLSKYLNSRIITVWMFDDLSDPECNEWILSGSKQHYLLSYVYDSKGDLTFETILKQDEDLKLKKVKEKILNQSSLDESSYHNSLMVLSVNDSIMGKHDFENICDVPNSKHKIEFIDIKKNWSTYKWRDIQDMKEKLHATSLVRIPLILMGDVLFGYIVLHPTLDKEKIKKYGKSLAEFSNLVSIKLSWLLFEYRLRKYRELLEVVAELSRSPGIVELLDGAAEMIKNVMNAGACSIFLFEPDINKLVLHATTAKPPYRFSEVGYRPYHDLEPRGFRDVKNIREIYYDIQEPSLTALAFINKKPLIEYDIRANSNSNIRFWEFPEEEKLHYSLICVPLITPTGEIDGVVRCINREDPIISPLRFRKRDVEHLQLLVPIITAEYAQRRYIRYIMHDWGGQLDRVSHSCNEINRSFKSLNQRIEQSVESLRINMDMVTIRLLGFEVENIRHGSLGQEDSWEILDEIVRPIIRAIEYYHGDFRKKQLRISKKNIDDDAVNHFCARHMLKVVKSYIDLALYNVIRNAVKYSKDRTEIVVEIGWEEDKHLTIDVTNEGETEIPQEFWDKIFERLVRGPNVGHLKGTGLGLFLAKQATSKQDVELSVLKSRNGFTTFRFKFPWNKIVEKGGHR